MLEAVEQGQLVDVGGTEGEALGVEEAARWHGAVNLEDAPLNCSLKVSMASERSW